MQSIQSGQVFVMVVCVWVCVCVCDMIVNSVKDDLRHSLPVAAYGDAVWTMKLPLLRKDL